jgi:hypothetical protein
MLHVCNACKVHDCCAEEREGGSLSTEEGSENPHALVKRPRAASGRVYSRSHSLSHDMHDMLSKFADTPQWPHTFGLTEALLDTMSLRCGVREEVPLQDGVAHAFKDCVSRYRGLVASQAIVKVMLVSVERHESVRCSSASISVDCNLISGALRALQRAALV